MATVRFTVTGPNVPTIRAAAEQQLGHLDPKADWEYDLDVTAAVRPRNGGVIADWTCEVQAWDKEEVMPMWVAVRRDPGLHLLDE